MSFRKARTQTRNLESFQVRGCGMERYKDSDHVFLVGMLFVLMCVWLSASCLNLFCLSVTVCVWRSFCLSVSISVSRPRRVCFSGRCLSVCLSRTLCVSCLLCLLSVAWRLLLSCVGLGCTVLSCLGLSCLVLSTCHQSVLSFCVYSSSRSPSFVCPLVIPFVLSFLCSFIRPRRHVQVFFSREHK